MPRLDPLEQAPKSGTDALEKRSLVWSAVGLGMLLVICLIGSLTLRQVNESDFWVDHTRVVITTNRQVLSDVKDAQGAERGYIITGEEAYLEPYNVAAEDIPRTLAQLRQMTSDNPAQHEQIARLQELVNQRLEVLHEGVEQRRASGFEAAQAIVVAGKGREVMEQIRDVGQQIESEEYRLLQQRVQTRQSHLKSGFAATLAAALMALVVFVIAPLDVRRAVRQRDAALRRREESELTVRTLFQTAAQGIFMVDQKGEIVSANPAAVRMLGYSEGELVGQPVDVLVPESMRGGHSEHRSRYFGNPQNRPMGVGLDLRAQRKDGSLFDAEISLSYVSSARGVLAVAFVSDISRRKADEQAIRRQGEDLRRLAGRLMTAQDEERRRIARDLHDDLSQKLAYLAMDIGKFAGKALSPAVVEGLRPLQRRAVEAAESVRHISHQLHPSILDDIGLSAALEQYCEEFQKRSGITTHFSATDVPDSLPKDVAGSVYQIFQESLRNVSKHSKADEVFVTIAFTEDVLHMSVRDEGVGLPAQRLKSEAGIGIVGMKERAHLVNGKISIESRVGEGTEISVSVPVMSAG